MTDLCLHMSRVTIEASSPLSASSGEDGLFDTTLTRDANSLPQIPGASIQGVLRHLHLEVLGDRDLTHGLFGYVDGNEGQAGRLYVGFASVHDSTDAAVVGLQPGAPEFTDPLLRALSAEAPLVREHVCLDDRHVVLERGKFDRVAVPVGTRFSFEIALYGSSEERTRFLDAVSLVRHRRFRLGGGARRGYGRIEVVRRGYACLPLETPNKIRELRTAPASSLAGFTDLPAAAEGSEIRGTTTVDLELAPVGMWRIGSTGVPDRTDAHELHSKELISRGGPPDARPHDVDDAPLREPIIVWDAGRGTWLEPAELDDRVTVPGSSIKGPLAHRTLYHWNRLQPDGARLIDADAWYDFSDEDRDSRKSALAERPTELQRLFGAPKTRESGRAASVTVEDAVAYPEHIMALDHNSIDRFTGGVRSRILFSEEVALGGRIHVSICIRSLPGTKDAATEDRLRTAFCCALHDLGNGRLALGAKSLGFCEVVADPVWQGDDRDVWEAAWKGVTEEQPGEAGIE